MSNTTTTPKEGDMTAAITITRTMFNGPEFMVGECGGLHSADEFTHELSDGSTAAFMLPNPCRICDYAAAAEEAALRARIAREDAALAA
jgi:hypothetical protein